jgi:hypothetical protein
VHGLSGRNQRIAETGLLGMKGLWKTVQPKKLTVRLS